MKVFLVFDDWAYSYAVDAVYKHEVEAIRHCETNPERYEYAVYLVRETCNKDKPEIEL